jgi:hypothetical protein
MKSRSYDENLVTFVLQSAAKIFGMTGYAAKVRRVPVGDEENAHEREG